MNRCYSIFTLPEYHLSSGRTAQPLHSPIPPPPPLLPRPPHPHNHQQVQLLPHRPHHLLRHHKLNKNQIDSTKLTLVVSLT